MLQKMLTLNRQKPFSNHYKHNTPFLLFTAPSKPITTGANNIKWHFSLLCLALIVPIKILLGDNFFLSHHLHIKNAVLSANNAAHTFSRPAWC